MTRLIERETGLVRTGAGFVGRWQRRLLGESCRSRRQHGRMTTAHTRTYVRALFSEVEQHLEGIDLAAEDFYDAQATFCERVAEHLGALRRTGAALDQVGALEADGMLSRIYWFHPAVGVDALCAAFELCCVDEVIRRASESALTWRCGHCAEEHATLEATVEHRYGDWTGVADPRLCHRCQGLQMEAEERYGIQQRIRPRLVQPTSTVGQCDVHVGPGVRPCQRHGLKAVEEES